MVKYDDGEVMAHDLSDEVVQLEPLKPLQLNKLSAPEDAQKALARLALNRAALAEEAH